MKVLEPSRKRREWTKKYRCKCGALLEVTRGDVSIRELHDPRTGETFAMYDFVCPECKCKVETSNL